MTHTSPQSIIHSGSKVVQVKGDPHQLKHCPACTSEAEAWSFLTDFEASWFPFLLCEELSVCVCVCAQYIYVFVSYFL